MYICFVSQVACGWKYSCVLRRFKIYPNMQSKGDRILNEEQWKIEAEAVINDVKKHVRDIRISDKLGSTNQLVYLNLTTLEDLKFCVELSSAGFTVVGNKYDDTTNTNNEYFETPYSLLDFVSPQYRNAFGNSLVDRLNELNEHQ